MFFGLWDASVFSIKLKLIPDAQCSWLIGTQVREWHLHYIKKNLLHKVLLFQREFAESFWVKASSLQGTTTRLYWNCFKLVVIWIYYKLYYTTDSCTFVGGISCSSKCLNLEAVCSQGSGFLYSLSCYNSFILLWSKYYES